MYFYTFFMQKRWKALCRKGFEYFSILCKLKKQAIIRPFKRFCHFLVKILCIYIQKCIIVLARFLQWMKMEKIGVYCIHDLYIKLEKIGSWYIKKLAWILLHYIYKQSFLYFYTSLCINIFFIKIMHKCMYQKNITLQIAGSLDI